MKKTLIPGLILMGLSLANVQAEEVCNTVEDCRNLKVKVENRLAELLKYVTPELTEVLGTGVTHTEAEKICLERKMRLPTARELVIFANGLESISETKINGYREITAKDSAGNRDHFYYSNSKDK